MHFHFHTGNWDLEIILRDGLRQSVGVILRIFLYSTMHYATDYRIVLLGRHVPVIQLISK